MSGVVVAPNLAVPVMGRVSALPLVVRSNVPLFPVVPMMPRQVRLAATVPVTAVLSLQATVNSATTARRVAGRRREVMRVLPRWWRGAAEGGVPADASDRGIHRLRVALEELIVGCARALSIRSPLT